jgi:enamine deaminase RidA (YjgF/YER057c/UK114 family)
VATDPNGKVVGPDDFDAQCRQTFANIEAALKSAGAGWSDVVEFTTYLVHSQDIAKFMAFRLREFPKMFANGAYPPNTLLIVDRLVQEPFLVEVQTRAAL